MYSTDMFCFGWMDRRDVRILSTLSSPTFEDNGKPAAINLYNHVMPGVDAADQMRHGRQVARARCRRWDKKVFYHLIDIALVNSFIISKHLRQYGAVTYKHAQFRLDVVAMILAKYKTDIDKSKDLTVLMPADRRAFH